MRVSVLAITLIVAAGLGGCSAQEAASQITLAPERAAAADLAAKTDVSNAKVAVIGYQTNDPGAFPTVADLGPWGYTASEGVPTVTLTGSGSDFCVGTTSETGTAFHATTTSSVEEGACP